MSESTPEVKPSNLKPFKNLPPNCTTFEAETNLLKEELAKAIPEMLAYFETHSSGEPTYRNCKDELSEIRRLIHSSNPLDSSVVIRRGWGAGSYPQIHRLR